ncbi:MAG: hypothetical protein M5U35_02455 [Roseovarius sp.]|nr:hypothetical protein [Roseovarius sp.]
MRHPRPARILRLGPALAAALRVFRARRADAARRVVAVTPVKGRLAGTIPGRGATSGPLRAGFSPPPFARPAYNLPPHLSVPGA